ncbi:MAG TPA: malto-oligosyltrehalose synthase [Rhodocyclaceae bacterium]|nr:malto-oligosyltrehalose synthase [Rhodocyclaceae bacterium]
MIPRATVRLQFRREFTLVDALRRIDLFAALGISHIYASPLQKACEGSTYGYDIVDYTLINPELGGEAALKELVTTLRARGMGLILDIVPNHMAASYENLWWRSVLESGNSSPYADYFDIDWQSHDPVLHSKVLAPFLGQTYDEALSSGSLKLRVDAESGHFFIEYFTQRFPIALRDYSVILNSVDNPRCKRLAALFKDIGSSPLDARYAIEARRAVAWEIANGAAPVISKCIGEFSSLAAEGSARLHRLLERQHYRLAWWRSAAEEINWRRFFEISDLIGMRTDRNEVFAEQHALIFRLYAEGIIDGVRIDHIDGLPNPRVYCQRLREQFDALASHRSTLGLSTQPYIVVEKILAENELIAADWHVDGTTGYDFMDEVSSVLHDEAGAEELETLWRNTSGDEESFDETLRAARAQLLDEHFVAEFDAAIRILHRVARANIATREVGTGSLRRALRALLVCFPVYRLYGEKDGRQEGDLPSIQKALNDACGMLRKTDHAALELVDRWLGGDAPITAMNEFEVDLRLRAMTKFQQLTPPLAAKSLEDTVFYRYGRLLSRNEVGSNPQRLSRSPAEFHECCLRRQRHFPHSLLATASHDHKRGEDVRARLAVLSEIPQHWELAATRWHIRHAQLSRAEDGSMAPEPGDEYMLYQMLVGAWPATLNPHDADGLKTLAERLANWQQKALREAKRQTDWALPNTAYEERCQHFLWQILGLNGAFPDDPSAAEFVAEVATFVSRIECAGIINSLTQTLLRLTCPGIPDMYQGTDLWDYSLVDPDNRTPVDYDKRIGFEGAGMTCSMADRLLEQWRDGRIKQQIIAGALGLRKKLPRVFSHGHYQPLEVEGAHAQHVIAFARHDGAHWAIVCVTRLPAALLGDDNALPKVPPHVWTDTMVKLPSAIRALTLTDTLVHRGVPVTNGKLRLSDALTTLPVALLVVDMDSPY